MERALFLTVVMSEAMVGPPSAPWLALPCCGLSAIGLPHTLLRWMGRLTDALAG